MVLDLLLRVPQHNTEDILGLLPQPSHRGYAYLCSIDYFFSVNNEDRCPGDAFTQNMFKAMEGARSEEDNVILMLLDDNMDMKVSEMTAAFQSFGLQEVIWKRHGMPIDGIGLPL
jgi:hypothetical protein